MKFIDQNEIFVESGSGGRGIVSFRSARNRPKLGADGGDGGRGGDVVFEGCSQLNTLSTLRYRQHYRAEAGQPGGSNGRTGRGGSDLTIKVPLGTEIFCKATNERLGEILEEGQRLLAAKGGHGGIGNIRFLRANHQRPEEATSGGDGQKRTLRLELKLMAEVGLCGFPNAGKSTLLANISSAKPKIADYPFTTLTPQLGVVNVDTDLGYSFVVADIPGLIAGASLGKGLGTAFLKHLERTKVLAFVIDGSFTDEKQIVAHYLQLNEELRNFGQLLVNKPQAIIVSKCDLAANLDQNELTSYFSIRNCPCFFVSALERTNLGSLKRALFDIVHPKPTKHHVQL